jgi:glutamine cyclotransferase
MKKILAMAAVVVVAVAAIPVAKYKTLSPCSMLRQELVNRAKHDVASMTQKGKEQAGEYGEDYGRIADGIGAVIENAAAGIAEGLAEERVKEMSLTGCAQEWWRIKFGKEEN